MFSSDPMKIAFKDLKFGTGVDVWVNNMVEALKRNNISCDATFWSRRYQYTPSLLKYTRMVHGDESIVHSNIVYGYAFKNDQPLVVTEHHVVHDPSFLPYTSFAQKLYYRQIRQAELKSLKVADVVTCISRYTQTMIEKTLGCYDSKLIYCGIDTEFFRPIQVDRADYGISPDKTILLFTGNLSKRKGADLLPAIMNLLGDDYVLLTTSGLRSDLKSTCGNIRTLGTVSRP